MSRQKTAVIIGAGPAGLTAAYELLTRTQIRPVVIEMSDHLGGISRTVNYKGNRIDIGGHRFFSKSDRVMNWWFQHLPMQQTEESAAVRVSYQGKTRDVEASRDRLPSQDDQVMLIRERKSRIYYRFGERLYRTFFKSYTEKVWGVACTQIDAEWGAQRIKELSIWKTIKHFVSRQFRRGPSNVAQKNTDTSLIEQFLYPKFGPGQMWEEVARKVVAMGGTIIMEQAVQQLHTRGTYMTGVTTASQDGALHRYDGDYVFSTMPVQELIRSLDNAVPPKVMEVSDGLMYRDFMTVGLLLNDLKIKDETEDSKTLVSDNWIYIQEPDVLAGRLQIFNNWSPAMVSDPEKVWIGVEYFCNEGDGLWTRSDEQMKKLAVEELVRIGIIEERALLDSTVLRMPKAYPAYFGTYARFDEIRAYLDGFENLFLLGRNGMHRYNNQDHSMLTAMTTVDNIISGQRDKANIWELNTEMEYHEERASDEKPRASAVPAGGRV